MKNLLIILVLSVAFASCNNKKKKTGGHPVEKKQVAVKNTFKTILHPGEAINLQQMYTDTVQFIAFNDDGDYGLLFAEKGKDTIALIYDEKHPFVRGDEIEIKWKMDTIRRAGDPEFPDFTKKMVSARMLKALTLKSKEIKILWRETRYSETYQTDISSIILNEEYLKTISEPERATLAYVATFTGNECGWDGKANAERSNLKCKILTALDLGYQCSPKHLNFLRQWFRNDSRALKKLDTCPTTPDGATFYNTFDEITLKAAGSHIIILSKITAVNVREGESASWTKISQFKFEKSQLKFIKEDSSELKRSKFSVNAN